MVIQTTINTIKEIKMYNHFYAIDSLPPKCKLVLKELYPNETSDIQTFLKATECYHDLDQWVYETRAKQQMFYKKYKMTKCHFNVIKHALISPTLKLSQPVSILGNTYTKISKNKESKKQKAFYFRPLKIYLTN